MATEIAKTDPESGAEFQQEKPAKVPASPPDPHRIFSYIKEHVGLLVTVTSLPLLSQLFGILDAPVSPKAGFHLNVLSSFLCLVAFALAIGLQNVVAYCITHRRKWMRALPHFGVFLCSLVGIILVAALVGLRSEKIAAKDPEVLIPVPAPALQAENRSTRSPATTTDLQEADRSPGTALQEEDRRYLFTAQGEGFPLAPTPTD